MSSQLNGYCFVASVPRPTVEDNNVGIVTFNGGVYRWTSVMVVPLSQKLDSTTASVTLALPRSSKVNLGLGRVDQRIVLSRNGVSHKQQDFGSIGTTTSRQGSTTKPID